MAKYIVTVYRTETYSTEIEVEANSFIEAEDLGIEEAQKYMLDWQFTESDIEAYPALREDE